jgi:threonine dehydratase
MEMFMQRSFAQAIESVLNPSATRRRRSSGIGKAGHTLILRHERFTVAPPRTSWPLRSDRAHASGRRCSRTLDALAGAQLAFKAEHLQRGGAFKFRGACNAVWSLDAGAAACGVVTHSSGNHGAALALAARTRGIPCHVVVPEGAVAAKLANIARHGATLWRCPPTIADREATCARVQAIPARAVHPYADPAVMAGQGTAALELLHSDGPFDVLVVPVGGGGFQRHRAGGAALAPACEVVLAEPAGATTPRARWPPASAIAFVPDTICDGLRTRSAAQFRAAARAGRR